MKRGEIWTVAGGGDFMSKPKPAVVIQANVPENSESVTICGFTSAFDEATFARVVVVPSDENGLEVLSEVMVDKVQPVRSARLRNLIGRLDSGDTERLDRSLRLFLGLWSVTRR